MKDPINFFLIPLVMVVIWNAFDLEIHEDQIEALELQNLQLAFQINTLEKKLQKLDDRSHERTLELKNTIESLPPRNKRERR